MTQRRAEESQVAREKRYLFSRMQKPKNLLLIIPLGSPHFKPDLAKVNSPSPKLLRLVVGDVVVQNDHAAVLVLATISLTIPRG